MDIETLIEAAEAHGRNAGADHEVGDLQQLLRAAAGAMDEVAIAAFLSQDGDAHQTFASAQFEDPADVAAAAGVEDLIKAAASHGEESEPEMEAGDLQEFLRAAWSTMSASQRTALVESAADIVQAEALRP